jgi:hypothetical protein
MKKLALIYALLLVASPAAAQLATESTTAGRSGRPVHTDCSPTDWRFLHRGNDRDILQRNHRAEHEWLRVAQRVHIEQWAASSCGAGAISPSIPPCSSEPPFNELCN